MDLLDAGDGAERLGLRLAFIADDADDGALLAPTDVRPKAQFLDPLDDVVNLFRSRFRLDD